MRNPQGDSTYRDERGTTMLVSLSYFACQSLILFLCRPESGISMCEYTREVRRDHHSLGHSDKKGL